MIATTPRWTPSKSRIKACSSVCGMTPSSAATTSRATLMPVAPATMRLTNRSWPGTSTMPKRISSTWKCAKPSSMVMPRAFSSGSRSVSMPVRALTSAVLPWSMWPAVPRMRKRLGLGTSTGEESTSGAMVSLSDTAARSRNLLLDAESRPGCSVAAPSRPGVGLSWCPLVT